jgi:alanine or glycine:cation symporter, AGCS family
MVYSWKEIGETILICSFGILLIGSIILTFKTKFIQIRMLPKMFRLLFSSLFRKRSLPDNDKKTKIILPSQALFTAMSTTIGIGNIVGPAVAVRLGGPGALLCFLVALLFGAATTFTEVVFALNYRKKLSDGSFAGGAMQYLAKILGHFFTIIYSFAAATFLVVWSSHQSNTLSDTFSEYNIPRSLTGAIITILVLFYLIGGIKKIGQLSSKIVPFMFVFYCSSCLWIIIANIEKFPATIMLMVQSMFSPEALVGAASGITVHKMLRWGLTKGTHSGESGLGTAGIPHSQSMINSPIEQGILSMVSIYSVALVSFFSGFVLLITGVWQDNSVPLGISMIKHAFAQHIPASSIVLAISIFLIALGTIIGNAYNGSRCFLYATKNRWINWYHAIVGAVVYAGAMIVDVEFLWSIADYFVVPVALINIIGVLILAFKRSDLLQVTFRATNKKS